jgi:hypothetical protein
MGKPFSINYAPDQWGNAYTNSFNNYGGINVGLPENILTPNFSPSLDDIILKNGEPRSRPTFVTGQIPAPDANPILGLSTPPPLDTNPINAWTVGGFWAWTGSVWVREAGNSGQIAANVPISSKLFQGILYYTNGTSYLSSWTGTTSNVGIALSGGNHLGAYYLDELDNHLLLFNTVEYNGSTNVSYPQRVRWSASGIPNQWDPSININAGFADLLDTPDSITGNLMTGREGYILRNNGMTELAPTGSGLAPFDFNHMWNSTTGIGNVLPYSFSQYGNVGFFVAADNIYMFTPGNGPQAIGGGARDAIFSDIYNVGSLTSATQVFGVAIPYYTAPDNVVPGSNPVSPNYTYLQYMLVMRGNNGQLGNNAGTRIWLYSVEDNNWVRWNLPGVYPTGRPSVTGIGTSYQSLGLTYFPVEAVVGGAPAIGTFDTVVSSGGFNDAVQGSTYSYRQEDVEPNRVPTVRRVIVTYRDLGAATMTVTVNAINDNGANVTASKTQAIGGVNPGALCVSFFDLVVTGFHPQLTISRAANGGPISWTRAVMVGESEEVTL